MLQILNILPPAFEELQQSPAQGNDPFPGSAGIYQGVGGLPELPKNPKHSQLFQAASVIFPAQSTH